MNIIEIIEKKKNNQRLTAQEITYFVDGYVQNTIADYQASALLMAICINGMDDDEIFALTKAMIDSGEVYDLSSIPLTKCDKHSTGGVGDKTTLVLAPLCASCGVVMAKMSGRGLAYTGGTIDKLESIDGFNVTMSKEHFLKQLANIHIAITSQSNTIVPADQKIYSLRDVSGTVESIPLIASSIMSKKIASGADTILLDVKCGEGAFMKNVEEATELAKTMISIGNYFGKDVRAMITDMNQPLGNAIGNALEVKEAIATLQGHGPKDFTDLCLEAASIILLQAKIVTSQAEGKALAQEKINNNEAFNKFKAFVLAQGGNVELIDNPSLFIKSKYEIPIYAKESGYIHDLHALSLGKLAMQLGAGRTRKQDCIDPSVGIVLAKKQSDYVNEHDILAYVHTNTKLSDEWLTSFYDAFTITGQIESVSKIVYKVIE